MSCRLVCGTLLLLSCKTTFPPPPEMSGDDPPGIEMPVDDLTGSSQGDWPGAVTPFYHRIGGTVTGLTGDTLTLTLNGRTGLMIDDNGAFVFPVWLERGSTYAVAIGAQPLGHQCTLAGGDGTIATDVTDIVVDCIPVYVIGGVLSGLLPSTSLVLSNGSEEKALVEDGSFAFDTPLPAGNYDIAVTTPPAGRDCIVVPAAITVPQVLTVSVTCSDPPPVLLPTRVSVEGYLAPFTLHHVETADDYLIASGGADQVLFSRDAGVTFSFTLQPPAASVAHCRLFDAATAAADGLYDVVVRCLPPLAARSWTAFESPSGGPCDLTPGAPRCVPVAARLSVPYPGVTSCGALRAEDALGGFGWRCHEGNPVRFESTGLAEGKGLRALLDWDGLSFLPNRLTIYDGASATGDETPESVWWADAVVAQDEGADLSAADTVYLVRANPATRTANYTLHDHTSLLIEDGTVLTGTATTGETLVDAQGAKFVWLEGAMSGLGSDAIGFKAHATSYANARDLHLERFTTSGLSLGGDHADVERVFVNESPNGVAITGTGMRIRQAKVINASDVAIGVAMKDGVVQDFAALNVASAIVLNGDSWGNVFAGGVLSSTVAAVVQSFATTGPANTFIDVSAMSTQDGFYVADAPLALVNCAITGGVHGTIGPVVLHGGIIAYNLIVGIEAPTLALNGSGTVRIGGNGTIGQGDCQIDGASSCTIAGATVTSAVGGGSYTVGAGATVAYDAISDWFPSDLFRAYLRTSMFGPACQSGNDCLAYDFRLTAAGPDASIMRGANALPSAADVLTHAWTDGSVSHLRHATEIAGDGIGNDDALCEGGEMCRHSINIGAYQGSGALVPAATLTLPSGVATLVAHEETGVP